MEERGGPWVQVASGRKFWPLDPRVEEIHLGDIAHSLAHLCRFGGHTSTFYSVAQHSVQVSLLVPPKHALWALLHDSAEAYLGDMTSPLKEWNQLYSLWEEQILRTIAQRFGLPWPMPPEVHQADRILLITEARDFMGDPDWASALGTHLGIKPLLLPLDPLPPLTARAMFLARFSELV